MSLSDDGIAESEETRQQPGGAMPRVMASLIVAFFAYLGLALGGGFGALNSTETNNFSAAKGSQQPHYLTLRDTTRGIVAAERSAEPKASWHDGDPGLLGPAVRITFSCSDADQAAPVAASPIRPGTVSAYLARGPPAPVA